MFVSSFAFTNIKSQHQFVADLLRACGVDAYSKKVTRNNKEYALLRAYFQGKREPSKNLKKTIIANFDEVFFVAYFKKRINSSAVKMIVKNFELDEDTDVDGLLLHICHEIRLAVQIVKNDTYYPDEKSSLDDAIEKGKESYYKTEFLGGNSSNTTKRESHISLWVPDAEDAKEEQSGFKSFTNTDFCDRYLGITRQNDDHIKGILSAKGAGKTYILQMKRRRMNDIAIPVHHEKLSKDNGWGVESVFINEISSINKANVDTLASLWKASIVCLTIVSTINKANISELKKRMTFSQLSEVMKYMIENPADHRKLTRVMNRILSDRNWIRTIGADYSNLSDLLEALIRIQPLTTPIAVFIDKTDQAILQPEAETRKCRNCYRDSNYLKCPTKIDEKDENYEKYCVKCEGCCVTCEVYKKTKRPYGGERGDRYAHITKWQHLQIGLVIAVYHLTSDFDNRLQVYYSIRQEALTSEDSLVGGNAKKIAAHTEVLHYTKAEQREIFFNTIKIQPEEYLFNPGILEEGDYVQAFIGIRDLCHPYVKDGIETVFDCIYRHTFDRAREIQQMGEALSNKVSYFKSINEETDRAEAVKSVIETTAAKLLFDADSTDTSFRKDYYGDKHILLNNYWGNPKNFSNFIRQIDRNLLFIDDMVAICQKINMIASCSRNCDSGICKHHPFTMLYKMGLLGRLSFNENVQKDSEQCFLDSNQITYFIEFEDIYPNEQAIFIVHPALTKCIEQSVRRVPIKHFKGFILGKGLTAPRNIHRQLLDDKQNLSKTEFEEKYYS